MDLLERVEPAPSLTERAYPAIRRMLLRGAFSPGQRINEVELAQALGTSRGPVREALQSLAQEGLVERIARRGVFVRACSEGEMRDLAEVRELLEVHAVRGALRRAGVAELQAIGRAQERTRHEIERSGRYPSEDDFHQAIFRLARNEVLAEQADQLYARVRIVRIFSVVGPDRALQAWREHDAILAALTQRDEERAVQAVRQHIARGLERTLARASSRE